MPDSDLDAYLDPAPKPRRARPTSSHLDELSQFAKENNLTVGSTTGGRHNAGSLHYSGNAIDIKGSGAFDNATVGRLSSLASERGLKLRDERTHPKGQKVWGGPHIHLEFAGNGQDLGGYVDKPKGELDDYLDPLTSQPRKVQSVTPPITDALDKLTADVNRRMGRIKSRPAPRTVVTPQTIDAGEGYSAPSGLSNSPRNLRQAEEAEMGQRRRIEKDVKSYTPTILETKNPDDIVNERIAAERTQEDSQRHAQAERERLTASFTPEEVQQTKAIADQLRRHGPGVRRGMDRAIQASTSGLLYKLAGLSDVGNAIAKRTVGESWIPDSLRRKALAGELAIEDLQGLPQPAREKVADFLTSSAAGLLEIAATPGGPITKFAGLAGSEALGRGKPASEVLQDTARGAATGALFEGAGRRFATAEGAGRAATLKSAAQQAGTVGTGTLAMGGTPQEALSNAAFAGGPTALGAIGGRRNARQAETQRQGVQTAESAENANDIAQVGKVEAMGTPQPEPRIPERDDGTRNVNQPQRFYHRDYGEIVESPDQSSVRKGRIKVVAEDGSIHIIKRSNLRGQGNNLAIPIKANIGTEPSSSGISGPREAPDFNVAPDTVEPNPLAVSTRPVGLSFNPQQVETGVLSRRQQREILDPIVSFLPVDVVNMLGGKERATQVLLHDPAMLYARLASKNLTDVEARSLFTARESLARRRAEFSRQSGRSDPKLNTALDAIEGNVSEMLSALGLESRSGGSGVGLNDTGVSSIATRLGAESRPASVGRPAPRVGVAAESARQGNQDTSVAQSRHQTRARASDGLTELALPITPAASPTEVASPNRQTASQPENLEPYLDEAKPSRPDRARSERQNVDLTPRERRNALAAESDRLYAEANQTHDSAKMAQAHDLARQANDIVKTLPESEQKEIRDAAYVSMAEGFARGLGRKPADQPSSSDISKHLTKVFDEPAKLRSEDRVVAYDLNLPDKNPVRVSMMIKGETAEVVVGPPKGEFMVEQDESNYKVPREDIGTQTALAIKSFLKREHPEIKEFKFERGGSTGGEYGRKRSIAAQKVEPVEKEKESDTSAEIARALDYTNKPHYTAQAFSKSALKSQILGELPKGAELYNSVHPDSPEMQSGAIKLRAPNGEIWEVDLAEGHRGDSAWKQIGSRLDGFAVRNTGEKVVTQDLQVESLSPTQERNATEPAAQKVRIAGAEFDLVREHSDGTATVRNAEGFEFDTAPNEVYTKLSPALPKQAEALPATKDEFVKQELAKQKAAREQVAQGVIDTINREYTPRIALPVGISKLQSLMTKPRRSQSARERQLLAQYENARNALSVDTTLDAEKYGAVYDRLKTSARASAHKVMTREEYLAMPKGVRHEVIRDYDKAGGVGVRFTGEQSSTPSVAESRQLPEGEKSVRSEPEISEQKGAKSVNTASPKTSVGGAAETSRGELGGRLASTTAAKHESMRADRAEFGMPEVPKTVRKDADLFESAKKANADDPTAPNRIADKVLNSGHNLTDKETHQIIIRAQEIKNQHSEVLKEIAKATDSDVIQAKGRDADALLREFEKLSEASDTSGSEQARAFRARRHEVDDQYELLPMLATMKKAKGRDLTTEERARYENIAKERDQAIQDRDAALERARTAELQREIDKSRRQRRRGETKKELDDEAITIRQNIIAEIGRLKAQAGGVHSLGGLGSLDPEGVITKELMKYARNRIKANVGLKAEALIDEVHDLVKDAGATRRQVAEVLVGRANKREQSPEAKELAKVRSEINSLLNQEDVQAGRRTTKQEGPKPHFTRNQQRIKTLEAREVELQRKIDERDYSETPKRQPYEYTREVYKAEKRIRELESQFAKEKYKATRGVAGKLADTASRVGNAPKTMLSMGDISAVFRQGGYGFVTHPVLSSKAAVDMVKSFSEYGFAKVESEIKSHPKFEEAKRNGVEFTGVDKDDPRLSHHEEGYLGSDFINTIAKGKANPLRILKGVKDVSERTFVSFLDSQRMRLYDVQSNAIRGMKLNPEETARALKAQAKLINAATGRGNIPKFLGGNQGAPLLNLGMFSPRLLSSRILLLNKMFNPGAWALQPKGSRSLMMKDNAKFLAFTAVTLGLARASGLEVDLDPDSADFLKIKRGDTRWDTLTGLQQPMRFFLRMVKAVKGGETYSGDTKSDILMDFGRSKASPAFGYGWDFMEGRNRLSGKQFEAGKDLARTMIPLPLQDFGEAIKNDGYLRGVIEALPSLTGIGVQTYKGAAEKSTTKAEKLARRMIIRKMPDEARTQEEIDKSQKVSQLRSRSRQGENVESEVANMGLTSRQSKSILGARGKTRLQEDFNRLSLKDAIIVYGTMTELERAATKDILERKSSSVDLLPVDDQPEVKKRLESLGMKPGVLPRKAKEVREPRKPRTANQGYVFQ